MNFCNECGCKLLEAPKFCPQCGKPVVYGSALQSTTLVEPRIHKPSNIKSKPVPVSTEISREIRMKIFFNVICY